MAKHNVLCRVSGWYPLFLGSSPRSWRCFCLVQLRNALAKVFSTLVEVFLPVCQKKKYRSSLLHARGGVSVGRTAILEDGLSSPRSWRCFQYSRISASPLLVFSTLVEVFPGLSVSHDAEGRLLHARGGVSTSSRFRSSVFMSSPRSWRCFRFTWREYSVSVVFSTLVEVFPPGRDIVCSPSRLLHARGGVSYLRFEHVVAILSSPHSWRCFLCTRRLWYALVVFSTLVEVFLGVGWRN